MSERRETATFGAGCFWGVQSRFDAMNGVISTEVGYMGGRTDDPTYEEVCREDTDHAEVVQVVFDPEVIAYRELVEAFWNLHDPTQVDRQGPDYGRQYRSVIFIHSDEQALDARDSMTNAQDRFRSPIATEISPAQTFWRAEEYHQKYLAKRGLDSCRV